MSKNTSTAMKLPLQLVKDCLAQPSLVSRFSASSIRSKYKDDIKHLNDLDPTQKLALSLALNAESGWLGLYLNAIVASSCELKPVAHARFFNEYYYGLMRVTLAHADALLEESSKLQNIDTLVALSHRLNNKAAMDSSLRAVASQPISATKYGNLARWMSLGVEMFVDDFAKATASRVVSPNSGAFSLSATDMAFGDYLTHLRGQNLLAKELIFGPSLVTSLVQVPELLLIRDEQTT